MYTIQQYIFRYHKVIIKLALNEIFSFKGLPKNSRLIKNKLLIKIQNEKNKNTVFSLVIILIRNRIIFCALSRKYQGIQKSLYSRKIEDTQSDELNSKFSLQR